MAAQAKDEIILKSYFASSTNVYLYTFYYRIWRQFLAFVLTTKITPLTTIRQTDLQNVKAGCSAILTY